MAIAALSNDGPLDLPWPKPVLRLIEGGLRRSPADTTPVNWGDEEPWAEVLDATEVAGIAGVRVGAGVSPRRRRRRRARTRRRRLAVGMLLVGLLVALAAPVSALGGRPATGAPVPVDTGVRARATVYIVRPGDTLASIAAHLNGGPASPALTAALAGELGTSSVSPGERVIVP